MSDSKLGRRGFLRVAGGASVLLSAGALSTGCDNGSKPSNTVDNNLAVELPHYVPLEIVEADYPSTKDGVMAGYRAFPREPQAVTTKKPGRGGTISALGIPKGSVPPPLERNQFWQGLNERLGVELTFNMVAADYPAKLATVLAGNDLPDVVQIAPSAVPRLPDVLDAKFQDLSPYLSGEKIKKYPALANIPTYAWRNTVFNGGIYGLPEDNGLLGSVMIARDDLREAAGVLTAITDGDEFIEMCRAITDSRKNQWAIGAPAALRTYLQEMLGAPNEWRQANGRFTHHYEAEETKRAIEIVQKMWKEGLLHPDSYGSPGGMKWFLAGRVGLLYSNYASWTSYVAINVPTHPGHRLSGILPVGYDGGQAKKFLGTGINSMGAFKKASPDRIEHILDVANWLAAPFGTLEYLYRAYGPEGRNFTWGPDGPVLTPTGTTERAVPAYGIVGAPLALYVPGYPDTTQAVHEFQSKAIPTGEPIATIGLSSTTNDSDGPRLTKHMTDLESDIVQGRKPLSAWHEGVQNWKRDAGDAIRHEYEEAYDKANS